MYTNYNKIERNEAMVLTRHIILFSAIPTTPKLYGFKYGL